MKKLKLGFVGCGLLSGVVVEAWRKGLLPEYEIVGGLDRDPEAARALAAKAGGKACATLDELLALKPDYVVEAAAPAAMREVAERVLRGGASMVVLSIGAFADPAFLERVSAAARETGTRVHFVSGTIGGFDVLRAAALMDDIQAGITGFKGASGLAGTPVYSDSLPTETEPRDVFSGTAEQAIALFPTKVNVAVATALATTGPATTAVKLRHIPGHGNDHHRIEAEGKRVKISIDIWASDVDLAGWSVVARLRNLVSPIVF